MKFRLSVTMLEDRANPTDLLGTGATVDPTYDPGTAPAQQQPVDPAPGTGTPTPTIPPTTYPG